eukprot:1746280-Pyramimonas_sp.AAC.1
MIDGAADVQVCDHQGWGGAPRSGKRENSSRGQTRTWRHPVTGDHSPSPGVDGQKGLRLQFNSRQ